MGVIMPLPKRYTFYATKQQRNQNQDFWGTRNLFQLRSTVAGSTAPACQLQICNSCNYLAQGTIHRRYLIKVSELNGFKLDQI